jgi:hypothetical protein
MSGQFRNLALSAFVLVAFASVASADVINVNTVLGATTSSGPVNASATFVTGNGILTVTITDLLADPKSVGQLISGLNFTLSDGATEGTLVGSSGQEITVNSDDTYTLGSTGSTGWGLNNNVLGGLQLNALGFIGPAALIIGAPNAVTNTYSASNNSISGNDPHNPFLNQTATFVINIAGLTASDTVTSAAFLFGTTPGSSPVSVPEPGSVQLLGISLIGLVGLGGFRRWSAAQSRA